MRFLLFSLAYFTRICLQKNHSSMDKENKIIYLCGSFGFSVILNQKTWYTRVFACKDPRYRQVFAFRHSFVMRLCKHTKSPTDPFHEDEKPTRFYLIKSGGLFVLMEWICWNLCFSPQKKQRKMWMETECFFFNLQMNLKYLIQIQMKTRH
nr:hypothetical protein [Trentepohlia sp. YN1317]